MSYKATKIATPIVYYDSGTYDDDTSGYIE